MKIVLHIGFEQAGAARLQTVLAAKREQLLQKGILFPASPGGKNHTRLFMAVTDPEHVDPLRFNRGYITEEKQEVLRDAVMQDLARDVQQHKPKRLILSCAQLGAGLRSPSELARLKSMLAPLSDNIRILAHIDAPAKLLARHYAAQVLEGRATSLDEELALAKKRNWWKAALERTLPVRPAEGMFAETQAPAHWLDFAQLEAFWESAFGAGRVAFRGYDPDLFFGENATREIRQGFGVTHNIGKADPAPLPKVPTAASIARGRQLNMLLLEVLKRGKRILPRKLWRQLVQEVAIPDGAPIDPGALHKLSARFAKANAALATKHGLDPALLAPPPIAPDWHEADPMYGYRASQYLLGFMWRIDKATREERQAKHADLARLNGEAVTAAPIEESLTPIARKLMTPLAIQNFEKLRTSSFAPHNRLGAVDEEQLAAAFSPAPARKLPKGSSGNVIVGCMKNEAPYIVEWVAYHRAIGIDNFLIYTNGCEDGTSEILDRLQEMGVVQHRNNDNWKGNSPQQYALNQSLKEPVIKNAEWIIHIDVDEFMNIRCGNGTVQDFLAAVPDATNVAMTWRLFGHNGVTELSDDFVIDQFDTCAPRYCPKPHTVWGFKTMFKNIGAYEKISCHRPNKLDDKMAGKVKWVNGSGKEITSDVARNGWRSSKKTIGYDLLQLNHYALRSAESFLIKRQRGRALHVDRSIGINYWIRMDWSDFRDVTIKRNLPRLRAEYDRLMQDETLRALHGAGMAWHRAKADELHKTPEFHDLYAQALKIKLTETERVAYALALDMES